MAKIVTVLRKYKLRLIVLHNIFRLDSSPLSFYFYKIGKTIQLSAFLLENDELQADKTHNYYKIYRNLISSDTKSLLLLKSTDYTT